MRYYEYMREEGRRMDKEPEIKVGDRVTPRSDNPDDAWVGVVEKIYTHGSDLWADVTYMGGFDTVEETLLYEDLELWRYNDYSSEEDNVNHPSHYGTGKIASDGGPSEYYDFPEGCSTLNDLIEYKDMSFAQGNIFKAAYRLGNKEGISLEYDLKKIKYYADRMLAQIGLNK